MHKEVLLLTLVAVTLSTGTARSQVSVSFVSDPTWETFAMNPDGSQGASLGLPQCVGWTAYFADLSAIPGACWMWMPGVDQTSPADLQGAYFAKSFVLLGVPVGGEIMIAVDDFAEVRVNGSVVGSTGSVTDYTAAALAQSALRMFDITSYLTSGANTITVRAQNGPHSFAGTGRCDPCTYGGNPAAVIFGGTLTFEPVTPALRATWGRAKARYR